MGRTSKTSSLGGPDSWSDRTAASLSRATLADPVALRSEPELTWSGTLSDPAYETEFREHRFERELRIPLRWSAWSATLLYFLFGALDSDRSGRRANPSRA